MASWKRVEIKGLEELRAAFEALKRGARNEALEAAALAGAEVIREAAVRKGPGPHVITKVRRVLPGKAEVDIGPDKAHWYYQFFELGAGPHRIRPRRRRGTKALYFGGRFIAKVKHHPGMAARPFLRPALDENESQAVAAIGAEIRRRMNGD